MKPLKNIAFTPGEDNIPVECHPWQPFIPDNARVLLMGTFPPAPERWTMPFYYPNRNNDFWRVIGLLFYDRPLHFYNEAEKTFNLEEIVRFLTERGIALSDTGRKVKRLRGNASDAFLQILEAADLAALLPLMPHCGDVAATGTLAAEVIASLTDTRVPPLGNCVTASRLSAAGGRDVRLWRMPSTSRAYPLPLAAKAESYARLFSSAGIL